MAHDVPSSDNFTGLSRAVLVYSERFARIVESLKDAELSDADWAPLEELVDISNFVRRGVFLTDKPETIDWPTYRAYITQYGGATQWEATLRHLTEQGNHVVLELEERNTRAGFTSIANTAVQPPAPGPSRVRVSSSVQPEAAPGGAMQNWSRFGGGSHSQAPPPRRSSLLRDRAILA